MNDGDLKSLLSLWENLACNLRYSSWVKPQDIKEVRSRVANEGLPFLTVALPELGKAMDIFHATNTWPTIKSFRTDGMGIPYFLGEAIYAAKAGNSVAVDCVRQLSYVFYKLEVQHDPKTIDKFLDAFIANDREVGNFDFSESNDIEFTFEDPDFSGRRRGTQCSRSALVKEMARIIARVLSNSDPHDIRPCHGGGSTACRTPNHKKWSGFRYFKKLDDVFGYTNLFYFNETHLLDELEVLESSVSANPQARVCLVPKDSRGPRVISCEPRELMFAQQGLMRKLYDILETNHITRGQINFTDQRVNRALAFQASLSGKLATIDLKDASDRVSLELVRGCFPSDWLECLEACRSEETILPNDYVVKLNKFAPMGSACCFPVEALVFWACAQAATRLLYGISNRQVYVYGDDIICDTDVSKGIMEALTIVGLKVNYDKSYVSGPFRESCGGDYHKGYDVTPVRVKEVPNNVGTGLDTCADLCNEFIAKFGYESVHRLISDVEEVVGFVYPRTEREIPLTLRVPSSASNEVFYRKRWNSDLQIEEHRILASASTPVARRPPDWWELLRKELSRDSASKSYPYENSVSVMERHLGPGWYVDVHSTHKKWKWAWLG
jgi:hypothetical protein